MLSCWGWLFSGHVDVKSALHVQVLYECKANRSEILAEAVPEAMKNVLLVMAAQGVLTPSWTVRARDPESLF
jgi:hypothetical protein